jgi:BolA protein
MAMEDRIKAKLTEALKPVALEVENQSHLHAGHAGDDGSGESHFHLMVVSLAFEGTSRVERHRMIFDILKDEMTAIHALAIKASSPSEYK